MPTYRRRSAGPDAYVRGEYAQIAHARKVRAARERSAPCLRCDGDHALRCCPVPPPPAFPLPPAGTWARCVRCGRLTGTVSGPPARGGPFYCPACHGPEAAPPPPYGPEAQAEAFSLYGADLTPAQRAAFRAAHPGAAPA